MKTIKDIMSQMGFVDSEQCSELAKHFPNTKVVIQWGGMPREQVRAIEVAERIKNVEDSGMDYVRQCFICSKEYRMLKEVFAIAD
tara:strand:- start:173 stop:427 length:255 start_codon:yes stop_codon:yes gene_type:complete